MKNVAVLVHPDAGQEARLQVALDLTRALNGHLTAIEVTALAPLVEDPMMGGLTAGLIAEDLAQQEEQRIELRERIAGEEVAWSAEHCAGDIAYCLAEHTSLADLVVINTRFDGFPGNEMDRCAATLIDLHRSVLAVPTGIRGMADRRAALIAWDGSDAAEAALRASIPLLALYPAVSIICIDRGGVKHPPELAAAYLSRHGIKPDITVVTDEDDKVAHQLIAHARGIDASLIVMGGFGHSRLVETLFGGVTRTLLHESDCPLFLSQ